MDRERGVRVRRANKRERGVRMVSHQLCLDFTEVDWPNPLVCQTGHRADSQREREREREIEGEREHFLWRERDTHRQTDRQTYMSYGERERESERERDPNILWSRRDR